MIIIFILLALDLAVWFYERPKTKSPANRLKKRDDYVLIEPSRFTETFSYLFLCNFWLVILRGKRFRKILLTMTNTFTSLPCWTFLLFTFLFLLLIWHNSILCPLSKLADFKQANLFTWSHDLIEINYWLMKTLISS